MGRSRQRTIVGVLGGLLLAAAAPGCGTVEESSPDADTGSHADADTSSGADADTSCACEIDSKCIAAGETQPGNSCSVCDPEHSTTAWVDRADGADCSGACGSSGSCSAGVCEVQSPCDDGLDCTAGSCGTDGECVQEIVSGCAIDGACVAEGATSNEDACLVCDPDNDATDWTSRADGASCGDQSVCMSSGCTEVRRVFTTSGAFFPDLGGLGGADERCKDAADAAGLAGTYRAWLSDDTASPLSRFTPFSGPYVRTDGTLLADDFDHLTSTDPDGTVSLHAPPNVDASGSPLPEGSKVFSATEPDGSGSDSHCVNWTSTDGAESLGLGRADETTSAWTRAIGTFCSSDAHLYCFEQ